MKRGNAYSTHRGGGTGGQTKIPLSKKQAPFAYKVDAIALFKEKAPLFF